MTSPRPTVVLTGSTGVIGTSLLPALTSRYDVTALVHRRRPPGATVCLRADLTQEGLGLDHRQYHDLVAAVDVIVHCAALTAFAPSDLTAFDDINAEGTRRIMQLASDAQVPVVLLSSAAVAVEVTGDDLAARSMRAYSRSKRRAEDLAAQSRQPVAIVRPALLFAGRHATGAPRHQFPHALFELLLRGRRGGLPINPDHWCDILPMEMLVAYVSALVDAQLHGDATAPGIHWVTAGPARLTAADVAQACTDLLREAGRPVPTPLLSPPAARHRRTHGMGRMAQLGFQPPTQPPLPCDLRRLLPAQLTRTAALEALTHNVRRCAPWDA
ncbi:SDR family oxidoreductase [Streptomyces sp. ASQP_92]|uniref:SDR family oxidoreductase n=1 Tax=Streptomyces sp. ASQP_92 TaxID=2979116 RepID=UPI0021C0F110|nr:SDR family oxidoreductase [Streptomyces sp. ASQP_92]MCT9091618.1 SDR family oxidoreductase [Streptomyces sp. ASQP_92]